MQKKRTALLSFVNTILNNQAQYKFDVTAHDVNNNTLLHRMFWLAVTTNNAALSENVTTTGIKLLTLLKGASEFRKILAIKNNFGENFLQNIYLSAHNQAGFANPTHLSNVQRAVALYLEPFKSKEAAGKDFFDFNKKSFKEFLEDLLLDAVTFEIMQNPVLLVTEGHTLDRTTWDKVDKNPISNSPNPINKATELKPNAFLKKIINLYQQNKDVDATYRDLKLLLDTGTDTADEYVSDVTLSSIKGLVKAYEQYLEEIKTPEGMQKYLAATAEKIARNIPGENLKDQEKIRHDQLLVIADCLKTQKNLTTEELSMALGLLKAICDINTKFISFSKPASAAELAMAMEHLTLKEKECTEVNLTSLDSQIQTFVNNVKSARSNNNNNNNNTK